MHNNRRQNERIPIHIPVKVASAPFSGNPPVVGAVMSNISPGGVYLESEQDFPMASKVYMEFTLAFEELNTLHFVISLDNLRKFSGKHVNVHASGVVIRIQKGGSGIIFDTDYTLSPI